MTENGVCKSRDRKDIDVLLDLFNIQVENPVAVLDQEQAKKFLKGKDEEKWDFFNKATELERLDNSYNRIMESIEEMEEQEKAVNRTLESEGKVVTDLQAKWEEVSESHSVFACLDEDETENENENENASHYETNIVPTQFVWFGTFFARRTVSGSAEVGGENKEAEHQHVLVWRVAVPEDARGGGRGAGAENWCGGEADEEDRGQQENAGGGGEDRGRFWRGSNEVHRRG